MDRKNPHASRLLFPAHVKWLIIHKTDQIVFLPEAIIDHFRKDSPHLIYLKAITLSEQASETHLYEVLLVIENLKNPGRSDLITIP